MSSVMPCTQHSCRRLPGSYPPQSDRAAVLGDLDVKAIAQRRRQDEPEPVDIGRQLDGGTDDLTSVHIRPEVWVIVADAELAAIPGDDERVRCLHRPMLAAGSCQLAWPDATVQARRLRS